MTATGEFMGLCFRLPPKRYLTPLSQIEKRIGVTGADFERQTCAGFLAMALTWWSRWNRTRSDTWLESVPEGAVGTHENPFEP